MSKALYGIGSPFGDDNVGWAVVDAIKQSFPNYHAWVITKGKPIDLLQFLQDKHTTMESLVIVDAIMLDDQSDLLLIESGEPKILTLKWPSPEIEQCQFQGTHDLSLSAVLQLADSLAILPKTTTIFGIPIATPPVPQLAEAQPSASLAARLPAIINHIVDHLSRA